jgi:hypothetical protein
MDISSGKNVYFRLNQNKQKFKFQITMFFANLILVLKETPKFYCLFGSINALPQDSGLWLWTIEEARPRRLSFKAYGLLWENLISYVIAPLGLYYRFFKTLALAKVSGFYYAPALSQKP